MTGVIVYRDKLLPYSETFIQDQAEGLSRYDPVFAGTRRVAGLELPTQRVVLLNGDRKFRVLNEVGARFLGNFDKRTVGELQRHSPALVHAHFGQDGVSAGRLAKRLGIPLCVTYHGSDVLRKSRSLARGSLGDRQWLALRSRMARSSAAHICVSNYVATALRKLGFPQERIVVHYIGVDTSRYKSMPLTERSGLLFVGRLEPNKGCAAAIEVASALQKRGEPARLSVIGDGSQRAELEQLASKLRARVDFLGAQTSDRVAAAMSRARLLCAPSGPDRSGASEGFGRVVIEAEASGLPVVAYATGGIPEALKQGETGWAVSTDDLAGLVVRASGLFKDDAEWQRMSTNGLRFVAQNFELRHQTRLLEAIYDRCVGGIL